MRTQVRAFLRDTRQQTEQSRHSRIATVSSHQHPRAKRRRRFACPYLPGAIRFLDRSQRARFTNFCTELTRPLQEDGIERAAFDRDLSVFPKRQVDPEMNVTHIDKFHPIERTKRQDSNALIDFKSPQDRPALRIQTIAAHLLTREFFALSQDDAQSAGRTKSRAGRARRSAPNNRHIENLHLVSVSRNKRMVKAISLVRFRRKLIRS